MSASGAPITARYYDGAASDQGLFYGDRIDMAPKNIDSMMAAMTDHSDCADAVATEVKDGGHGKPTTKKTGDEKKPDGEAKPEQHPVPVAGADAPADHSASASHGASAPLDPEPTGASK